jgi:DNA-binding transcriptional regulator/RsmH inhibitor MraZ
VSKSGPAPWQVAASGAVLELLEAKSRGRFTFPARATAGLAWLTPGAEALGVVEEHGRVRLLPWLAADSVRAKSDALVASSEADADDQLLLLHDRYLRLHLDLDARIDLPPALADHLEVSTPPIIYFARVRERVELWSRAYREQRLVLAAYTFRDLP